MLHDCETLICLVFFLDTRYSYIEGPTYVSTDIVPQSKAVFPAMTVCPEGGAYKKEALKV